MNNEINLENMVDKLNLVKTEFIKDKELLKVSIRKDVVAVELKSILDTNTDYSSLKVAINQYIDTLYDIK